MRKPNAFFAILFALISLSASSQQVWTLEQCVNHALTNNLQVKQQMLLVESAKADLLQSKLDLLPGITGNATHAYNYGQTVDRYTNQFATSRTQSNNFYLQSGVTLFNGFQKLNSIKQSQLNLMASQQDADKYMNDMSINIATFYMQVLFYKELVLIRTNQLDITRQQVERMKKLVDAGTMAQGDSYTIEAQYAVEESSLIEAENNLELSLLTLSQLLDLPSADGFDIEVPALNIDGEPSLVANPDQIFTYAQANMPEIKAAEYRLLGSEKQLARAKGGYYPSLSLSGSWGTGYSGASQIVDQVLPGQPQLIGYALNPDAANLDVYANSFDYTYKTKAWSDQISDNNNQSIGLYLTIPILNGWQSRTNVSKAKIALDNSKIDLEVQKLQLRKTIQQAWADARASLKQYHAAEKKVNATRESFRYAEQKFDVGIMNSVDYNNAKKDLSNAESEQLQSKFDFIFKTTVLDFYMGRPLSLK
ncbi:MAG: TolC family protein [Lentimicrobiaceae bacterium]|nr:TolC family protein [Lentimicrobiaceae bacterium]MCO5265225.1 TolC family protein [Lentimicrobium sp.]